MAESALSIDYGTLRQEVGAFLGYGTTIASWSAAQAAEIERYVQSGVRQFYYPPAGIDGVEAGYSWSFLNPTTTIDTAQDDAAQDLPDDLGRVLDGGFFYEAGEHRRSIVLVSEARLHAMMSRSDATGPPQVACVRHKTQEAGSGQRLEVAWWPVPDKAYTLTYRYEAYSGKLTEANPYPLGGMRYAELLTESCLAVAEQRANDERGMHTEAFFSQLAAGISMDRKQGARFYGPMTVGEDSVLSRRGQLGSSYDITYKGSTW